MTATLLERLGDLGRGVMMPSFRPDFSVPPENAADPAPPPPAQKGAPAARVFATLRRNGGPNPAARALDPSVDFPAQGFADRVGADAAASAQALGASLFAAATGERLDAAAAGNASFGHQGLASYIYTCWARERGAVLRPDMVWFTVCSELARAVLRSPETWRALFTSANEGQAELRVFTEDVEELPLGLLMEALARAVPDRRLRELVAEPHFASAAPGTAEVMAAVFASAATPFYNYVTYRCGIPHVCVVGEAADWARLRELVEELAQHLPDEEKHAPPPQQSGRSHKVPFAEYLSRVAELVGEIAAYAFADMAQPENVRRAQTFFSGMFWITRSCGSGHPYYCRGWLAELYHLNAKGYDFFCSILDFPTHLSLVPYRNEETNRKFCTASGLLFSMDSADGSFLVPCYGQLRYEITDDAAFARLRGGCA